MIRASFVSRKTEITYVEMHKCKHWQRDTTFRPRKAFLQWDDQDFVTCSAGSALKGHITADFHLMMLWLKKQNICFAVFISNRTEFRKTWTRLGDSSGRLVWVWTRLGLDSSGSTCFYQSFGSFHGAAHPAASPTGSGRSNVSSASDWLRSSIVDAMVRKLTSCLSFDCSSLMNITEVRRFLFAFQFVCVLKESETVQWLNDFLSAPRRHIL